MARTKGAKDKAKRKIPVVKSRPASRSGQTTPPQAAAAPAANTTPLADRPAIPADDFKAAIAAELRQVEQTTPAVPGSDVSSSPAGGPAPASFDPSALTAEGMAHALQLPFWALGSLLWLLRIIPDPGPIVDVGKRRAPELAKAVYPIYDYYARQYIGQHPDQTVNASIHVTILDGIGIVPDLIEAVISSRRQAAEAAAQRSAPAVPGAVT